MDEEALAEALAPEVRRERGAYFTPRTIVERTLALVEPYVPSRGRLAIIDPACGAGAFLSAAQERWPRAALCGVELESASAAACRTRVPGACVVEGDALAGDALEEVLAKVPAGGFELWLGNPPYNGTSPLLKNEAALARALSWGPERLELPKGRSLREDYVFFLLRASHRLAERQGALAFVTSSTLLDAFLYAPIRRALLDRLALREVADLGAGAFRGTRVRTCITVWTTARDRARPRFHALAEADAASGSAPTRAATTEASWAQVAAPAESMRGGQRSKSSPARTQVDERQAVDDPGERDARSSTTGAAAPGSPAARAATKASGSDVAAPAEPARGGRRSEQEAAGARTDAGRSVDGSRGNDPRGLERQPARAGDSARRPARSAPGDAGQLSLFSHMPALASDEAATGRAAEPSTRTTSGKPSLSSHVPALASDEPATSRAAAPSTRTTSGKLPLSSRVPGPASDEPATRRAAEPSTRTTSGIEFVPAEPTLELRPPPDAAAALDARWRAEGEPLTTLVPVSLPGLKTRFDELLVDNDADRLLARVREFLECSVGELPAFARRWSLSERLVPKLRQTREFADGAAPGRAHVRSFLRYRGPLPMDPAGFCYVDRRLIPRGDHRFRGDYDPHAHPVKLVFNVHELPLWARVLDAPGCVTAYRHSRFAPLMVPRRIRDEGIAVARSGEALGPSVPNLSPRGLAWAKRLGGARRAFEAIARFITSAQVQQTWAPAYGASRVVHVPLE